uniref:Uncharacterized protein n=1 Tax=Rhizophora mucronata TaxID=61149 RepID=A0A2P2NBJ3_RHIMU
MLNTSLHTTQSDRSKVTLNKKLLHTHICHTHIHTQTYMDKFATIYTYIHSCVPVV